jgi:uncharacterized protein (DUF302 family)
MHALNMKKTVAGSLTEVLERVTRSLQQEGFGVLTRIDLDQKFREKLGKQVPPLVILGACNPQLAFEAYARNPDVTSLLPCNVVLRELAPGQISVEIVRPSSLMAFLGDPELAAMAEQADVRLTHALDALDPLAAQA